MSMACSTAWSSSPSRSDSGAASSARETGASSEEAAKASPAWRASRMSSSATPSRVASSSSERAADVDLPALGPEVPLDLAADAGRGVSRQAVAEAGVEVADGLDQAEVADLHPVL